MDAVLTCESIFQSLPNLLSKKFRWHPCFLSSVCLKPTFSWILLGASFRLVPVTLAGLANTYSQAGNFCGVFALWFWTLLDPVILIWMVTQPHKNQSDSTHDFVGSFLPSATCNHTSSLRPATFGSEVWSWSKGYWKQRREKWSKNVWNILRNSRRIHSTWDIFGWLSSSFFANSCVLAAVSFLCLMDFNTKIILPAIWVTCFASFCLPPHISWDPFQIDWVGNALPRICTKVDTAVSLASSAQLRPFSYCQILTRVCNCIAWLFIAVGNHQFSPSSKFLILTSLLLAEILHLINVISLFSRDNVLFNIQL